MKRFISIAVAFVLMLGSSGLIVFARDRCECGTPPIVVISGFATVPLTYVDENGKEERAWAPSNKRIFNGVAGVIPPLTRLMFDKNWETFLDKTNPGVVSIFEPILCDGSGVPIHNIKAREFPLSADNYPDFYNNDINDEQAFIKTAIDVYGGDHIYFFNYDWRLDPTDIAKELKDFVKNVKNETRHDKVTLIGCSMGGNIALSYLRLFGSGDIHNFILDNAAFQGTSIIGECFMLDFEFDSDAVLNYIYQFVKSDVLDSFLRMTGVFDKLIPAVEDLIEIISGQLSSEVLYPVFANLPGIWALVTDDTYEQAKAAALDSKENARLIKKIDFYHYEVQQKAEKLLKKAKANGCNIMILSNYNYYGIPITPTRHNNNDILIDTRYSSGGAVCAKLGSTLGEGYVQKKTSCGHNHVSPDNVIDASTCMFPEYTWFVKDMKHLDYPYGTQGADFLMWLAGTKKQPTVFSEVSYPQFMEFDYKTGKLTPTAEAAAAAAVIEVLNPQTGG